MNKALVVAVGLLLLPGVLLVRPLSAEPPKTSKDISRDSGKTKKDADKSSTGKKDLIEDVFALKKGVVLRRDQQDEYDKLKADYTPKLQDALDKKDKATKQADKDKAAREFGKFRSEVKQRIAAILKQPDPNAVTRAQQAVNRANAPRPPYNKKYRRY